MLNRVFGVGSLALVVAAVVALCVSSADQAAAKAQIQPSSLPLPQLDVTHNDYVNASDAVRVISAWTEFQQAGGQCAAQLSSVYDVDQSNCIDVVDAQKVAAAVGQVSGPKGMQLDHGAVGATTAGATFTVNSDGNEADTNPGDGQCHTSANTCTLNAAIQEANILPGHETINFDIKKNGSYPSVVTIYPPSYPISSSDPNPDYSWFTLDDARNNGVTIDGYTQPGASVNTGEVPNNARIVIELKGRQQLGVHGILINSDNNVVRGLSLYNWDRKFAIYNARYNHIEGNFIGTNVAMTAHQSNMGTHHSEGIRLQYGASYNAIGCGNFDASKQWVPCTDAAQVRADRNLVTGNGNDGIHFERNPVIYNHIVGNWVGIKQDGVSYKYNSGSNRDDFGNGSDSLDVEQGPQYNWIGGETPLERNVVAGNESDIEISHGTDTQYNRVVGNYIGTDATGTKAVRNCGNGVSFEDTPNHNLAYNNLIAGNYGSGVRVYRRANYNEVYNNIIGIGADGGALPNGMPESTCPAADYGNSGVYIVGGGQYTLVHNNIIANHPQNGIKVTVNTVESGDVGKYGSTQATNFNTFSQNSIYHNAGAGISFHDSRKYKVNEGLAAPTLTVASTNSVVGTTCPSCKVEVFIADTNAAGAAGEGKTFIGDGIADGNGNFAVTTTQTHIGDVLTSTATNPKGSTSMFGSTIAVTQDAAATETAIAGTAQAEASATALVVQQTADAQATTAAMTAIAQTATAQAGATQTTIVLQTDPALAATATAQAATAQAATASAIALTPGQSSGTYKVMLPLMSR
jgi:hypothetical protein